MENQQSKLQIDELYDQITSKVFVVLNLKEFEKMLKDNWIFDQDEFINQLNNTLYNYNLEIEKEFSNHKNEYKKKLEEYIYQFFTKETLINRISELFINETKEFKDNQIKEIRKIIEEILQKIKQYIDDESKLIQ